MSAGESTAEGPGDGEKDMVFVMPVLYVLLWERRGCKSTTLECVWGHNWASLCVVPGTVFQIKKHSFPGFITCNLVASERLGDCASTGALWLSWFLVGRAELHRRCGVIRANQGF